MKAIVFLLVGAALAAEAAAQGAASVLEVHALDRQGRRIGSGAGVVIGLEQVVTNCHVLAQASAVTVSRGNVTYGAALEYPDPERDLCQLKVRELPAPALPIAGAASARIGQRVLMHVPGAAPVEGRLSGMREADSGAAPVMELSMVVPATASGSPVLDEQGRLVGIASFNFRGQRLNLALPGEWLRELPARGREVLAKHRQALGARATLEQKDPAVSLVRGDASQAKEMPREGDTWTYAVVDVAYKPNDRSRKFVHTIRSVKRGTLVEEVSQRGVSLGQASFTDDVSALYRPKIDMLEVAPYLAAFRRLNAGDRLSAAPIRGLESIAVAAATGETPYEFDGARVVGPERVTVPAGTFDAIRVEFDGRMSSVLLNMSASIRGYAQYKQIVWYAPQVKRVVRQLMQAPGLAMAYELESYQLN